MVCVFSIGFALMLITTHRVIEERETRERLKKEKAEKEAKEKKEVRFFS